VELTAATARWQSDLRLSRWINVGRRDFEHWARRTRHRLRLWRHAAARPAGDGPARPEAELARQVEERTRELTALSTHLQTCRSSRNPRCRANCTTKLGGLLVAGKKWTCPGCNIGSHERLRHPNSASSASMTA